MQEYLSQTLYHFAGTVFQIFASLSTSHDNHALMSILFYSVTSNLQARTRSRKPSDRHRERLKSVPDRS